jgi:hypothetical protein
VAGSVAFAERAAPAPVRVPSHRPWAVSSPKDSDEVAADRKADTVLAGQAPGATTPQAYSLAFGYDFSKVRVHTDGVAAEVTRSYGAEAITIGRQIFFAPGVYQPHTPRGRHLLVHELAHVTQHDEQAPPRVRRQFAGCASLMSGPNISLLAGTVVHQLIQADFARRVQGAIAIVIPGGSFAPYRTGGVCGGPPKVIPPQVIGGAAGFGIPDLARINPMGTLSVAEIKPAVTDCLLEGETQLANYIGQGNAQDAPQQEWRRTNAITAVVPMLPTVYPPPQFVVPTPQGAVMIRTAWCMPGLLAYAVQNVQVPVRRRVEVDERQLQRERLQRDLRARDVLVPVGAAVATATAVIAGRALWRHFWKAVIARFALRAAIALGLSAADGPLPVGELISLGLAIVTIVQIGVEWNELWQRADQIAANEGA